MGVILSGESVIQLRKLIGLSYSNSFIYSSVLYARCYL